MTLQGFFATHPVFTHEELVAFLGTDKARSPKTREALLAYHQKQGRILRVRRGLYCVVPFGADRASCPVDAYLLAAKMTDDAVLAYHTALEFHAKAYSIFEELQYLTGRAARPVTFRSHRFRPVRFPKKLSVQNKQLFGVKEMERAGITVRATTLERTLVDVFDRPDLAGGWEEIWRSLETVEFFDLDLVVQYALLLENATTAAKVGFFLDQHKEHLMVEQSHLDRLRARRPR
ncbi:MAG: type IV toxin-antitoxin system AbiEi family antitoxin domain-containing protein, partial [Betaproteobacteria bacterium]|nr:type IV toxin-antitoxin system AbiEi family antitoxin domain-containing protein [Betaproteobacteria bacterium]